jgi:hypothetical protein
MKTPNNKPNSNGSKGGPRTKAGKNKSRLNALKHGLYSTLSGSGSKYQRLRARIHRKNYAMLAAEILPKNVIEEQFVDAAANALVQIALVLGFENARIEDQAEKPARALKELEAEINRQRQYVLELDEELTRLEAEKITGLQWADAGGVRDSFLDGVVLSQAREDVVLTFQSLSAAQERKAFFSGVVQWDEATLWNHLQVTMKRTRESHATKAEELSAQVERGRRSGAFKIHEKRLPTLSKEDTEFILDSINKCNRQFSRAIDSLMRYREGKSDSGAKKQPRGSAPDEPAD